MNTTVVADNLTAPIRMNPLEVYAEAGSRAGTASKRGDAALASHHSGWMRRAIAMENELYKAECRKAFDDAYREAATPSVRHF